jgi:Zn-dependent M28 family amino/carboxypeptidase
MRGVVRLLGGTALCAALRGATAACANTGTTEARETMSTQSGAAAPQAASAPIAPFDSARAWEHLERQVRFGPRPAGSAALADCRRYIEAQLTAAGLTSREQTFTAATPNGPIAMANIIATIPGKRADRIIIASHYDTKLSKDFRFVGASDGASSTAALLELGRILKGRQGEFTIELLFLDGEEAVNWDWRDPDNTYGSRHYVEQAQADGSLGAIKTLILLDMEGDRDLTVHRDSNSTPWLTDIIWDAAGRLGHRDTFPNDLTTIEDDHIPFLRAGVAAVDIIDLQYPQWHTAQDDLDHVSARSLQIVGDVVVAALPEIERRLATPIRRIGF